MTNFKLIVDILASIASFVAIVTVLWTWFQKSKCPVKIERVLIHNIKGVSCYFLFVKNRKPFPITIDSIHCYSQPCFKVEKKPNQKIKCSQVYSSEDSIFYSHEKVILSPNGFSRIDIDADPNNGQPKKAVFLMSTSHGYLSVWCSNIKVEIDAYASNVFSSRLEYEYNSKFKAIVRFIWLKLKL